MSHPKGEYRVLWIRRSWVGLLHLDSSHRFGSPFAGAHLLVEGEIVTPGPELDDGRLTVASSRIDPGYGRWPPYQLEEYSLTDVDPALGPYFRLVPPGPPEQLDVYYVKRPVFPVEEVTRQVRVCRRMMEEDPPLIEAVHRLGEIEWIRGRRVKALKYLETAWRLGAAAIPPGFRGAIDARNGENLPFFCAGADYARALAGFSRDEEAIEVIEFLERLDRPATWRGDDLKPPLAVRSGRGAMRESILGSPRELGIHEFLRALLLLREGLREEAARAVCRGTRANPLLLAALLDPAAAEGEVPFRTGRMGFGPEAELQAALTGPDWHRADTARFLARMLGLPAFREARDRAAAVARACDEGRLGYRETREQLERTITDAVIEATARAIESSSKP